MGRVGRVRWGRGERFVVGGPGGRGAGKRFVVGGPGGRGGGFTVTADDASLVLACSVIKQHMTVNGVQQGQHRAGSGMAIDMVTMHFHGASGMIQGQGEEVRQAAGQVAGLTAAAT